MICLYEKFSREDVVVDNQISEDLCLIPVLIILAITAIRRGWGVLHSGEFGLPPNEKLYIGLIRFLKGDESADQAYKNTMKKPGVQGYYAWMNIIGGVVTIIVCLAWVIALIIM